MIHIYEKKPVQIEAMQFDGNNGLSLLAFVGTDKMHIPKRELPVIETLEGDHMVSVGDFVIKGVEGEFYPCKPRIFNKTYAKIS